MRTKGRNDDFSTRRWTAGRDEAEDRPADPEFEAAVIAALGEKPPIAVPEGFALRVTQHVFAQPGPRRSRLPGWGPRLAVASAGALTVAMFALAPHAVPSLSNTAFDGELLSLGELAVLLLFSRHLLAREYGAAAEAARRPSITGGHTPHLQRDTARKDRTDASLAADWRFNEDQDFGACGGLGPPRLCDGANHLYATDDCTTATRYRACNLADPGGYRWNARDRTAGGNGCPTHHKERAQGQAEVAAALQGPGQGR